MFYICETQNVRSSNFLFKAIKVFGFSNFLKKWSVHLLRQAMAQLLGRYYILQMENSLSALIDEYAASNLQQSCAFVYPLETSVYTS